MKIYLALFSFYIKWILNVRSKNRLLLLFCIQHRVFDSMKGLKLSDVHKIVPYIANALFMDGSKDLEIDKIEEIDLHKHKADKIKLKCEKCEGEMTRIPEVIDCWVESGSMPFAEHHYPFENEKLFKSRFPGKYIAEYISQTRAWFYYMHAMAVLLFDDVSFEHCVTTGTILNDKGEKLSKSKQNFTDPWEIINQYGMDSLRYYLMSGSVMQAENLFFKDEEVREVYNKVIMILSNVHSFYSMYSGDEEIRDQRSETRNVLDKWILAKLNLLVKEVTEQMDNYNTVKATRPLKDFIDELSTWYLRRSRDRFKGDDEEDKKAALATMHQVLLTLSKLLAPFTPFIAEKLYQDLGKPEEESVHLCNWPEADEKRIDEKLISEMNLVRQIVEAGLAARAEAGIKIRQPLASYSTSLTKKLDKELVKLVLDELNIKELKFGKDKLETELTPELKQEGLYRELVRHINSLRKQAGLTIKDRVEIYYETPNEDLKKIIEESKENLMKDTLTTNVSEGKTEVDKKRTKEVKVEDANLWLGLK